MPLRRCEFRKAGGIADDQSASDVGSRHRIPAAGGHGLRAVTHELAAFENAAHEGMGLEFLKRFVGIETRIVIFEPDDEAERNAILAQPVNPSAPVHAGIERPAERVRHPAGRDAVGRNIPQFLDADAVGLRIQAVELFSRDEIFGERAARALGQHGDFRAQFVAGSEIVLGVAVFVAAFVVGDDAGDAVAFIDELRAGKLREDVDARLLDQRAEPLDQFIE